jgi:hypothetical protein
VRILQWEMTHSDPFLCAFTMLFITFTIFFIAFTMWLLLSLLIYLLSLCLSIHYMFV